MAVTWNANYELTPLPQDSPTGIDDEVRALKDSISARMKNEHETFETDNSSGAEGDDFVHKAGSAKGYYQAAEPTLRPDGVTALNSEDAGRAWIDSDTDITYRWDGSAWGEISIGTFSSEVTFEDDLVLKRGLNYSGAWGTSQATVYTRPDVSSGSTSILWRHDGEISTSSDDRTILANFTSKINGTIRMSCQRRRLVSSNNVRVYFSKNGVTIFDSGWVSTDSWVDVVLENITVSEGDVFSWEGQCGATTSLGLRYLRISVNEAITLSAWEKSIFGLTG